MATENGTIEQEVGVIPTGVSVNAVSGVNKTLAQAFQELDANSAHPITSWSAGKTKNGKKYIQATVTHQLHGVISTRISEKSINILVLEEGVPVGIRNESDVTTFKNENNNWVSSNKGTNNGGY